VPLCGIGRADHISERGDFFITNVHLEGEAIVARVVGEIDMANASTLGDELGSASESGAGDLVIDLEHVRFLDLAGLDALEGVCAGLVLSGRHARLRHPSRPVTLLLDLRRGWSMTDPWDVEW
jgi:anti-anti-sigma factor